MQNVCSKGSKGRKFKENGKIRVAIVAFVAYSKGMANETRGRDQY